MGYNILYCKRFRKKLRILNRSGVFKHAEKLGLATTLLSEDKELHVSFRDHSLSGSMSEYREFHLAGDLIVVYKINRSLAVITLTAIGSHSDIF